MEDQTLDGGHIRRYCLTGLPKKVKPVKKTSKQGRRTRARSTAQGKRFPLRFPQDAKRITTVYVRRHPGLTTFGFLAEESQPVYRTAFDDDQFQVMAKLSQRAIHDVVDIVGDFLGATFVLDDQLSTDDKLVFHRRR